MPGSYASCHNDNGRSHRTSHEFDLRQVGCRFGRYNFSVAARVFSGDAAAFDDACCRFLKRFEAAHRYENDLEKLARTLEQEFGDCFGGRVDCRAEPVTGHSYAVTISDRTSNLGRPDEKTLLQRPRGCEQE